MPASRNPIGGRYLLQEELGSGGMGVVWRALDQELGRQVALKQVNPSRIDVNRESLVERLRTEARAATLIDHENVIQVHDQFTDDDGVLWLVMEYVEGRSLDKVIAERPRDEPLPIPRVAVIGLGIIGGLEAAHKKKIIHRDLKPANVFLEESGRVVVGDFGISLIEGGQRITTAGRPMGTTPYMSPEQLSTPDQITVESDLWSLGATLYEAAEGESNPFWCPRACSFDLERARHAGPMVPILKKLLERDPADRPDIPWIRDGLTELAQGTNPNGA
ncbi:serine/threonine protein kinase [Spirillospora sp. NBC_00431]